jgi:hypothetical protein
MYRPPDNRSDPWEDRYVISLARLVEDFATAIQRAAPARLAAGDCLMGVQLGFMGVQLGGKVIWAGLLGCACGAGTGEQQREAVTVLP